MNLSAIIINNIAFIFSGISATIGGLIVYIWKLNTAWMNLSNRVGNLEYISKEKEQGTDRRLIILESTLKNIEISMGKVETNVGILLTAHQREL